MFMFTAQKFQVCDCQGSHESLYVWGHGVKVKKKKNLELKHY